MPAAASSAIPTLDLGVASTRFLKAHPDVLPACRKAQAHALDLIHDDPDANRPGTVALDIPIDLPRTGADPDELRGLPGYAALRAEIGTAVRNAAR